MAVSLKPLAQSMVNFEVKSVTLFWGFFAVYVYSLEGIFSFGNTHAYFLPTLVHPAVHNNTETGIFYCTQLSREVADGNMQAGENAISARDLMDDLMNVRRQRNCSSRMG